MKRHGHPAGCDSSGGSDPFPILPDVWLSPLARWLSKAIAVDFGGDPCVRLTVALAIQRFDQGQTALALARYVDRCFTRDGILEEKIPASAGEDFVRLPSLATWRQALLASGACGTLAEAPSGNFPLTWHEDAAGFQIALTRFAAREVTIANTLAAIVIASPVEERGEQLFCKGLTDEQTAAVAWALENRFTVISGGPGTGKTTTVATLVVHLLCRHAGWVVKMAAPSGKAAARLTESFRHQADALRREGLLPADAVVEEATTLHRLLGFSEDGQRTTYHAGRPIPADVVIVDEASMISAELMASLLAALAPDGRLVLLGDMDQLKSVEPGNVLGAVCRDARDNPHSRFRPAVHQLRQSFRFSRERSIGRLAHAIVSANPEHVLQTLRCATAPLEWHAAWTPLRDAPSLFERLFAPLRAANFSAPDAAPTAMEEARILCSQNAGPYGAAALNTACARHLEQIRPSPCDPQPIIVLENDYELRLFNGDAGVVMRDPATHTETAFFRESNGQTRAIPITLLPAHAPAYAMTVHKAQGSEYIRLAIILPPYETRTLSRALLYTAVTRFRESPTGYLLLAANEPVIHAALAHEDAADSLLPAALACGNVPTLA